MPASLVSWKGVADFSDLGVPESLLFFPVFQMKTMKLLLRNLMEDFIPVIQKRKRKGKVL